MVHHITDKPLHNKVLICCGANKWSTITDIFRNLENVFKIQIITYAEKKQILDVLVKAELVNTSYEPSGTAKDLRYRRLISDSSTREVAYILNMFYEVLGSPYHPARHIQRVLLRTFSTEITKYLWTNEIHEIIYWLDYLVFLGRATRIIYSTVIEDSPEDFYGRATQSSNKESTIGFSRSGFQQPKYVEAKPSPRCPQARS